MSTLGIIVASTRPGRVGLSIGQWIQEQAAAHGGFDTVELLDLAEIALPLLDEPDHPRLRNYIHQHTRDWSATIARTDALVFVMPEYNSGYSAPLKNAIDYLYNEWAYKAAGLVSYGGVSAGTRAAQTIKQVLAAVRMTPVLEAVTIPFVPQFIEDGRFIPNDIVTASAKSMLEELVRMDAALRPLREER
jgi:NAD(P)H-dependent FMN reductase